MKKVFSLLCVIAIILCVIPADAQAASAPEITAKAAILYEETNDVVLFESNADERLYPASMTKIMTAIVAIEHSQPEEEFTAYAKALDPLGADVYYLMPGEKMSFKDYLDFMLVPSYNEAANVIAYNVAGSIGGFIEMMNEKARELGCTDTNFVNAHGLHDDNHYTTARDMLIIAKYAMQNELFASTVAQTQITLPITNKHSKTTVLNTTNHLLSRKSQPGYVYDGAIGIKTGSTTPAGYCLAAACEADGLRYFSIVMGCTKTDDDRIGSFIDTKKLFNYGKDNFSMQPMLKATEPIAELPVTLSTEGTSVILLPEKAISALLPSDFKFEDVKLSYDIPESIEAPVEKGQAVGTLTVEYNGKVYAEMSLLCSSSLAKSEVRATVDKLENFWQSTAFKIIVISIVALIFIMLIVLIFALRAKRNKRRRYGRGRYSR